MGSPFDTGSSRQRSKSQSSFGSESPDSGLDDMRDFRDKLSNKELTLDNANETVKTFLSKRGSIETFVGELFDEYGKERQKYENMKDNEKYKDTDGYVRLVTLEKAEQRLTILEKIIEWREVQMGTAMVMIQKQNELITKLRGKDLSREVLDELKGVFDQKFESDKEKLEVVKETVNERIETEKKNLKSDVQDLRDAQRRMYRELQNEMNKTNQIIEALNDHMEKEIDRMDFSNELQQMMEMQKQGMNDLEQQVNSMEDQKIETEPQKEQPSPPQNNTNAPDQVAQKMQESAQSNDRPDPEEIEDWRITDTDTSKVSNPEFGFTHEIEPTEVSGVQWDALRQLDEGHLTIEEIREASEIELGQFPITQLENLVSREVISENRLPDQIVDELDV